MLRGQRGGIASLSPGPGLDFNGTMVAVPPACGKAAGRVRVPPDVRAGGRRDAGAMTPLAPGRGRREPLRVLIAGGGVAGLETLLALRDLAGRRVAVTLLT